MYKIARTTKFKKDFKLLVKRNYDINQLQIVLNLLATGNRLPKQYKEHPLEGDYINNLECHIKPDWLLIFIRIDKDKKIKLIRTGTHSDLFK
jgi:mRNA interferase YafQ